MEEILVVPNSIDCSIFHGFPNTKRQSFRLVQKLFSDNKINMIDNWNYQLGQGRKHCGKKVKFGYQHFLLFRQCFQKLSLS